MATKLLLDLTTVVTRPIVRIDGVEYGMAAPTDFGLVELARLERLQVKIDEAMSADDPDEGRAAEAEKVLDELVGILLPGCPAEVVGKLGLVNKLAIMDSFPQAAGMKKPKKAKRAKSLPRKRKGRRTGGKSSRGSKGSTGATQAAG